MKQHLTLLFALLCCAAIAQQPKATFAAANKAYVSGDFAEASRLYESVLQEGYESAALYNNLGNAYYRQGELALALINYERALLLTPRDSEIQENLAFVYSKTEDHVESLPVLFIVRWWQSLVALASAREWVSIIIVLLCITCCAVVVFFVSRDYAWRKGSLLTSGALTLLLCLAVALGISAQRHAHAHNRAIVTASMSIVKSSPDANSVDKFILHEGTKVTISDEVDGWHKIRIEDGNKGWITSDDITVI